jgi:hypothetical protein
MEQLNEIVKAGIAELEKRKEELTEAAVRTLEAKAKVLKEQLELLVRLPVPKDFFNILMQPGAKLWISKLKGIDHRYDAVKLQAGPYILTTGEDEMTLKPGAYRLLVLAIPQDIPKERRHGANWEDDYGDYVQIEQ